MLLDRIRVGHRRQVVGDGAHVPRIPDHLPDGPIDIGAVQVSQEPSARDLLPSQQDMVVEQQRIPMIRRQQAEENTAPAGVNAIRRLAPADPALDERLEFPEQLHGGLRQSDLVPGEDLVGEFREPVRAVEGMRSGPRLEALGRPHDRAGHEQVGQAAMDRRRFHEPAGPGRVVPSELAAQCRDHAQPFDPADVDDPGLQGIVEIGQDRRDPVRDGDDLDLEPRRQARAQAVVTRGTQTLETVQTESGIPHNYVLWVELDGNDVWVGTPKGLAGAVGAGYYPGLGERPRLGVSGANAPQPAVESDAEGQR